VSRKFWFGEQACSQGGAFEVICLSIFCASKESFLTFLPTNAQPEFIHCVVEFYIPLTSLVLP